jgi:HD-GYP domain-containing protein (c-di-GMP phosphodiesterase class II)
LILAKEETVCTKELGSFQSIPLVALQFVNSHVIDLYCLREDDTKPVLLCSKQQAITEDQLIQLKSQGHETLQLRKQDFSHASKELYDLIDPVLANDTISLETRFALLQIAYAGEIDRLFCKPRIKQYINLAQELGKIISSLCQADEMSPSALFKVVHHNTLPYSHVTNVAVYAVTLAQALEMASPEELDQIAVGCLLHEVGKLYLPELLLRKKGRISDHERQELERAPQLAYEALCENEDLSFGQLMMVYQQCERIDGTGYPARTLLDDIHPWAKLLALVDEFDSCTSEREHRSARSLQDALLLVADGAGTQFEPEQVLCWITNFQQQ